MNIVTKDLARCRRYLRNTSEVTNLKVKARRNYRRAWNAAIAAGDYEGMCVRFRPLCGRDVI